MSALFYIKLYLLTIPVFFLIDIIWLGYLGRGFYKKQIGFILSDQVNWTAAIAFYLIYIVGILVVAVLPALAQGSIGRAALWGARFPRRHQPAFADTRFEVGAYQFQYALVLHLPSHPRH